MGLGPALDCMEAVWHSLRAQGLSEDDASMAATARRPITLCTYDSRLAKFGGWCAEQEIAPILASLAQVFKFLMVLFEEGKQINTIKNYHLAIAAVHRDFHDGTTVK